MSDAHETEAFALDANWSGEDWADFARRLERERDEARGRADSKHESWMAEIRDNASLRTRVAELEGALRGIVHELATVPLGNNIPLDIARNAIAKKETNHG